MRYVPFGEATYTSGKNEGKPRTISFVTGIAAANAGPLPATGKNAKGEAVAVLEIPSALPTRPEFESADEVRELAGSNFDTWLVKVANAELLSQTRNALAKGARNAEMPPANLEAFVKQICDAVKPEGIFVETVSVNTAAKAGVLSLAERLSTMTPEEVNAAILAMAASFK